MSDLLGCICLYEDAAECERNCRPDHKRRRKWNQRPRGPPAKRLRFALDNDDDAFQGACHVVEQFERDNPHVDIVGVEARYDGSVLIWLDDQKQ